MEYFDLNGQLLKKGDVIDIHQTVNGEYLFVLLDLESLDFRYGFDISREYEYSKTDLIAPCSISGLAYWEIVGNINSLIDSVRNTDSNNLNDWSRYSRKKINKNLYSEIQVNEDIEFKKLSEDEINGLKVGYLYAPYTMSYHTPESLEEHSNFMKEYIEQHKYCPVCSSENHSTTLAGYVLNWNKKSEYKDLNMCVCSDCGDKHKYHDRVSVK